MNYLELVCTQDEFTAVPKATGTFDAKKIHGQGDGENDPAGNDICAFEVIHKERINPIVGDNVVRMKFWFVIVYRLSDLYRHPFTDGQK